MKAKGTLIADLTRPDGMTLYQRLHRDANKTKWEDMFLVQLKSLGVAPAVQQYRFCPDRKFQADFAWPDKKILVELEGGIWRRGGGAHSHPSNILRDIEKQTLAAYHGFRVFRFEENSIKSWSAARMMAEVLNRQPI